MKIKLRDDGWIALPAAARRRMGVTTGDELFCQEVPEGIILSSGGQTIASATGKPSTELAIEAPALPDAQPIEEPPKPAPRSRAKRNVPIMAKKPGRRKPA